MSSVVQTVELDASKRPGRFACGPRSPRPARLPEPFASASSASGRSARRSRVSRPIAPPPRTPASAFTSSRPWSGMSPSRATVRRQGASRADPSAFLRGNYDVVIEALDTVEPARTLVARLLGRGTSVVTANKALVAEHGAHLESIAAARGAAFRYEATALAAVPFLGMLADRPLVASVDRVLAIVNGTSNFLLTSLAESGTSFDQALAARAGARICGARSVARSRRPRRRRQAAAAHLALWMGTVVARGARHQRHSPRDRRRSRRGAIDRRHDQGRGVGRTRCDGRPRLRRSRVPAVDRTAGLAWRSAERHSARRPPRH